MKNSNFLIGIINASLSGVIGAVYFILAHLSVVEYRNLAPVLLIAVVFLAFVPILVEKLFKIKINLLANLGYQLFIFVSIILGSMWGFYGLFAHFDTIVHLFSGVLIALIAYSFVESSKILKINCIWCFIIVFAISMAAGGLWELWEFVTDEILANNSQNAIGMIGRNAIMDTMIDLVCDFLGSLVGTVISLILYKKKIKKEIA